MKSSSIYKECARYLDRVYIYIYIVKIKVGDLSRR